MPGVDTSLTTSAPIADPAYLRKQCEQLARWAFTDFEKAREVLDELAVLVTPQTPFDILLTDSIPPSFAASQPQSDRLGGESGRYRQTGSIRRDHASGLGRIGLSPGSSCAGDIIAC